MAGAAAESEDINAVYKHGRTKLGYAVSKGNIKKIDYLLKRGADVNAIDERGHRALYYALFGRVRDVEVISILLEAGATYESSDYKSKKLGKLLVSCASEQGELDVLRFLIDEFKVDVNTVDSRGKTALMRAAAGGQYLASTATYLIFEAHANPDVVDAEGRTALIEAASCAVRRKEKAHIALQLLRRGANPFIADFPEGLLGSLIVNLRNTVLKLELPKLSPPILLLPSHEELEKLAEDHNVHQGSEHGIIVGLGGLDEELFDFNWEVLLRFEQQLVARVDRTSEMNSALLVIRNRRKTLSLQDLAAESFKKLRRPVKAEEINPGVIPILASHRVIFASAVEDDRAVVAAGADPATVPPRAAPSSTLGGGGGGGGSGAPA